MTGLRAALENLKSAGCLTAYLNGSFVTSKTLPNDYDACWEEAGQKAKYMGELFPASIIADAGGLSFLEFF